MKNKLKLLGIVLVIVTITFAACNKKSAKTADIATLNAGLQDTQAALEAAKAGNASAEQIFELEKAVAVQKEAVAVTAQLNEKKAELEKAKSGNASKEEIEELEKAVAEIAEIQEAVQQEVVAVETQKSGKGKGKSGEGKSDEGKSGKSSEGKSNEGKSGKSGEGKSNEGKSGDGKSGKKGSTASAETNEVVEVAEIAVSATIAPSEFQLDGTVLTKYAGSGGNVTIPNNVTGIGAEAFLLRANITSLIIPDSVTGIGEYAFQGCENLVSITIEGTIASGNFNSNALGLSGGAVNAGGIGNLRTVYLAEGGGPGTYTRKIGDLGGRWTKQ